MPNLNSRPLIDFTFTDSLHGYAITGDYSTYDTNYVLRTTNKGDSWSIIYRVYRDLSRIIFLNQNTGFVCGGFNAVGAYLIETTDGGISWNAVTNSNFANHFDDMSVLSQDSIWVVDRNGLNGGIYRTTNGGVNWTAQYSTTSNPDKIYMYNRNIGFACMSSEYDLLKTTNSGLNWILIYQAPGAGFADMYFADSLLGWKNSDSMRITTNGGLNWTAQILPHGGMINQSDMYHFHNINRDTIWGTGGYILYPNGRAKPFLYRTTNGGINWLGQLPDTGFDIGYAFVDFTNKLNGWVYSWDGLGIHTVTGGNDTFFTPVKNISTKIAAQFLLNQNYPNPFNPRTVIGYQLKSGGYVKLSVYDITGRHITNLVNQKQFSGKYEVDFSGNGYSSGVYFYSLFVDNALIDTKRMILLK